MKGIRGSLQASKVAQKDVISTMPEEVITNILHCLPLQDAVKTSILSKDWKFKWTMITQLVFDKNFYDYLDQNTDNEYFYPKIISRLLFLLNGAITKFFLYLPYCNEVDVEDINCWIIYLSKKGIKEFKGSILTPYKAGGPFLSLFHISSKLSEEASKYNKKETGGKQETTIDVRKNKYSEGMHENGIQDEDKSQEALSLSEDEEPTIAVKLS
ncbi:F-box/FBD/LRR-repeat protein-like protein [Tanacetum coccineum]|uniref:F-box/FBD/LRR-repeat protein-like protein n=1 Tax=Tanacetum coccineum TaxID=301880 RepID=A0ABQ4YSF8_9ASTR